ncbi:MAG: CotH kinase family protein, partial [Limisphaerales bacterium]
MLYRWLTYLGAVLITTIGLMGAEVVPLDGDWRYWVGVSEASAPDAEAWRLAGFDDSGWDVAPAPFWYGQVQPAPGTELTDMRGSYSSVFLRRTFPVGSVADVSELELQAASDDGFIAWINGQEVARFNMPGGDVPFDGTSLGALGEVNPWPTLESYPIASPASVLVEGENVLAIHAFNASVGNSSDFVINASLSAAVDLTPPLVAQLIPSANAIVASLVQVEVVFSEGVTGVDAGDLLINGVAATDVGASTDSQYVFSFPQPDLGQVVVEWAADHGITDLSSQRNAFGGGNWVYELDPDYQPPPVLINEFMASNNRTLNDAFGDDSDWVELYNPGNVAVDLNGWYLTDQMDQLTRWRFPQVVIEPKGFLMVFASGRNLRDPLGQLHTDFVLGKDGGYLALVNSRTNVVAEFAPTYPSQETDISYGLDQSNPTWVGYFSIPTPGGPNAAGGAGFAPEVVFSEPSGTFIGSMGVELGLAYAMPGAVIRYTTDGSVVTETSPVYTVSLTLNNTTQVRARSFADGLLPSVPVMGMYIEVDGAVANYTSDLPVIILHNYGGGSVPTSIDQPVLVQAFEPMYGVTSLTNAPGLVSRGVFHLRGSSTLGYPKGSFFLETHDEDEFPLNVELLGLPRESDWVLYAPNNFEPILINNAVAHELSRQMGEYSPRTRFAVVFLNTGGGTVTMGNYNGIYVLEEKIKVDKNRVDIDRLQPEHLAEPEVTGGYLLSVDRADPGTSQMSAGGQSFNHLSPRYDEIITPQRAPQRNYIRDYLNEFYSVLTGPNWKDPVSGYAAYLDVDAAINHSIQGVVTFNVDGLRLSSYLRKPRGGKIVMGPVWDFDRTQGSTDGRDFNPTVWQSRVGDRGTDYFNADGTYSNPWYRQLFQDIDFWQRWVDRYQELRAGAFSDANVHGIVEMFADQVRREQPNEVNRWGVRPRSGTRTVDGYSYNFSGTYQGEVQWVKHWYSERLGFIDGNLLPRPVLSREAGAVAAGTRVTLSGPTGATLYYTLDGTDPRLPQGGVSSAAMVYAGPVTVDGNVRLVARAR